MSSQDDVAALAREVIELRRRLESLERATQLDHSSVTDANGNDVNARAGIIAGVQAAVDASTALSQLVDVQAIADGKVTVFYTDTAPTEAVDNPEYGDQWLVTAPAVYNGTAYPAGTLLRYDGDTWLVGQDSASAALAAAQSAQATADGKIVSFWTPTPPGPPTDSPSEGDLWYDTNNDNRVARWTNGQWADLPAGTAALAAEIVGKTLTGGMLRTAVTGSRVEIDDGGGLKSIRDDGSLQFQILRASTNNLASADGVLLGVNAVLRLAGGASGGYIWKDPANHGLFIRSTSSSATGGAISMYESSAQGNDYRGDAFNSAVHLHAGGIVLLRLLASGVVAIDGPMLAPEMRMVSGSGGTPTDRAVVTWGYPTSAPVVFFTAPPSGLVKIDLNISLAGSTATANALADVIVRQGTVAGQGVDLFSPTGIVSHVGTASMRATGHRIVGGLTPGVSYYTRVVFASAADTVTVTAGYAALTVTPSL